MNSIFKSSMVSLMIIMFVSSAYTENSLHPSCVKINNDLKEGTKKSGFYYFQIGMCEFEYIHNQETFNLAINYLKKASEHDYPPSYFALGMMYFNKFTNGSTLYGTKGEFIDLLNSIQNYKKMSKYHSALAENNLGEIYLNYANLSEKYKSHNNSEQIDGIKEILPDIDKAIYWLDRAAKHGQATAQGTLSDLYKQGIGVPQNPVLAYVWQNLSSATQIRYNKKMQNTGAA